MNYKKYTSQTDSLNENLILFFKFYRTAYIENILETSMSSAKSKHVENSVFSVSQVGKKSKIKTIKSSIKSFMFA